METNQAVQALSALAQDTRLAIFRLLVQAGPAGMAAGQIGEKLGGVGPLRSSRTLGARCALDSNQFNERLTAVPVKQFTGFQGKHWRRYVPVLRRGRYLVTGQPVAGDAPKDFIRVYEYGHGRRTKPRQWPAYIAKVGHKWYSAESATEQLMTRVGQNLGIQMAESRLMQADGQIRFLSRYFLRKNESLVHGAEIVEGYLGDKEFVDEVGREREESSIFTFQVLRTAIETIFPEQSAPILRDFIRMIALDTLVGNQDRHLYNWGVIVDPEGRRTPVFSPIYDTARGLFWNTPETGLGRFDNRERLQRYVNGSHPLIGWEHEQELDHFKLVRNIANADPEMRAHFKQVEVVEAERNLGTLLDTEFCELMSKRRRGLIHRCLSLRFELFATALA